AYLRYRVDSYFLAMWYRPYDDNTPLEHMQATLLKKGVRGGRVTVPNQYVDYYSQSPFFYQDNKHSFFVRPVTEPPNLLRATQVLEKALPAIPTGTVQYVTTINSPVTTPITTTNITGFFTAGNTGMVVDGISGVFLGGTQVDPLTQPDPPAFTPGSSKYQFHTFYHPQTCLVIKHLNKYGVDGVLRPNPNRIPDATDDIALEIQQIDEAFFESTYDPKTSVVIQPYPSNNIDFSRAGGYGLYNWELFFHAPVMIACHLMQNQKFAEAQKWFHYIFDPTETNGTVPSRYWRTKPFHHYNGATSIDELLDLLNAGNGEMEKQVQVWRENPFMPHVIARMRIVAYMKFVVMKYVDNLIAWGDQLFTRDTLESLNEATQLYILAAQILGRRPEIIARKDTASLSFNELPPLDDFSNALVQVENMLPVNCHSNGNRVTSPATTTMEMLYFCIPSNAKLLGYWDVVEDRLFKIRHCQNIQGVVRQLPLFQPPIDPALLVRAAAAGIDIGSVLNDLSSSLAPYRYQYLYQKAVELTNDVKTLGNALLSALEKKDAEELALLRSSNDVAVTKSIIEVRKLAVKEAEENLKALEMTQQLTKERRSYYRSRPYMNPKEIASMVLQGTAKGLETAAQVTQALSAPLAAIPALEVGAHGAMGSPVVDSTVVDGGNLSKGVESGAKVLTILAAIASYSASMSGTLGGYDRRMDDWKFQADQARAELKSIEKQILAAQLRIQLAEKDLESQELQKENAQSVETFMKDKYTNKELYSWMVSQLSGLYFQAYQMAYDMAKKAEKAYRFELGIESSN
ncbi:MAG: hypothetical protein AAGB22_05525, partial [Bacteroidota bacterium]